MIVVACNVALAHTGQDVNRRLPTELVGIS
jgi:glutamate racemase